MKLNVGYFFSGLIAFGIGVYYIISKNSATIEDIVYRSTYISRLQQYKAAYANLESSFGLGVGMNNFLTSPVTISILGVNNWALRTGNTVHNDLLRILAEYGLIGLISFIVCFIFLFTTTSKIVYAKAMIRGCKINIGVLLMIGLSSPAFNNITVIIICGFYMAIIRYYSSSATEETFLKSRYNLQ